METFGIDAPELPDKLDAVAGACSLARGFQARRGDDYLTRLPYDFDQEIERIRQDFSGDGEEELYRLTGKRFFPSFPGDLFNGAWGEFSIIKILLVSNSGCQTS